MPQTGLREGECYYTEQGDPYNPSLLESMTKGFCDGTLQVQFAKAIVAPHRFIREAALLHTVEQQTGVPVVITVNYFRDSPLFSNREDLSRIIRANSEDREAAPGSDFDSLAADSKNQKAALLNPGFFKGVLVNRCHEVLQVRAVRQDQLKQSSQSREEVWAVQRPLLHAEYHGGATFEGKNFQATDVTDTLILSYRRKLKGLSSRRMMMGDEWYDRLTLVLEKTPDGMVLQRQEAQFPSSMTTSAMFFLIELLERDFKLPASLPVASQ